MTDIQVHFQKDMQVKRCSIFFRRIRSSAHGENSGSLLRRRKKELGLDITDEQIEELKAHADDINYDVAKKKEKKVVRHDVNVSCIRIWKTVSESKGNHPSWSNFLLCR